MEAPHPKTGELLIQTRRTLVSTGTEMTIFSGDYPENSAWASVTSYPNVPGYSNVGRVIDVGEAVDKSWIGRRVGTYGRHAAYTTVNADQARVIDHAAVDDASASFFTIAEIVMNSVRRSQLRWGESVGVFGLGLLGQMAVRICLVAGALPVLAVDVSARRVEWAGKHSSLTTLLPDGGGLVEVAKQLTRGRMLDVVFEVTGNASAIPRQFEVLRRQGRFVVLSSPRGATAFDFHDYCSMPSHTIIGTHNSSHPSHATLDNPWTQLRDAELFFDLLASGRIDVTPLISHRLSYTQAVEWYPRLLADRSEVMGAVLTWSDD